MFDHKSDYGLNKKDKTAIVYQDAINNNIRLTLDDFSSGEEFLKWKNWSDSEYHTSEKQNHLYSNHTLSIEELSDEAVSIPAEDTIIVLKRDQLEQAQQNEELVAMIKDRLTETQFRRLWMYAVDGRTLEYIAKRDGATIPSVFECIASARKKVLKIFRKTP